MGHKAIVELVLDSEEPKRLAKFWREALDYRDYCTDANLAVLVPKEGIASPLLLQGSGLHRLPDGLNKDLYRLYNLIRVICGQYGAAGFGELVV
jgi:hypothetical protein